MSVVKFKRERYIISFISIFIIVIAFLFLNRHSFKSVEQILESGYYKDPDYPGKLRGQLCSECDNGVIRFRDSITLVDLMLDKASNVRLQAKQVLIIVQRHLLDQFIEYASEEDTDFAIRFLKHFQKNVSDHQMLSLIYANLHRSKEEMLNPMDFKMDKLYEARSLFWSYCSTVWGDGLIVQSSESGYFTLISEISNKTFNSQANWRLTVNTISRVNQNREFEVIPFSCFQDKSSAYLLVDYLESFRFAVNWSNQDLAINLLNRKPSLLSDVKEHPDYYRRIRYRYYGLSLPKDTDIYDGVLSWLSSDNRERRSYNNNLLLNYNFEKGQKHWDFSENTFWKKGIGSIQSAGVGINARTSKQHIISQCVPVKSNKRYRMRAAAKVTGKPNEAILNRAYPAWHASTDCTGQSLGWGSYLEPEVDKSVWQLLTGQPLIPAMDTRSAKIMLVQERSGTTGYWDNIEFYPLKEDVDAIKTESENDLKLLVDDENLILNGSFDKGLSEWDNTALGKWKYSAEVPWIGWMALSTHDKVTGTLRAEAASKGVDNGVRILTQCVKLGKQRKYFLRAKAKRNDESTQPGSADIRVTWYSQDKCLGQNRPSEVELRVLDVPHRQELTVIQNAPESARSALIKLSQHSNQPGSFIVNWDDIELTVNDKPVDKIDNKKKNINMKEYNAFMKMIKIGV